MVGRRLLWVWLLTWTLEINFIFGVFPDYILDNGAILNSSYPYTSVKESCRPLKKDQTLPRIAEKAVLYNLNGDEKSLKNIMAQEGPIVVVMNATPLFMKYKSGVFSDTSCANNCRVNHAVLLIGELIIHFVRKTFNCTIYLAGYGVDAETGLPYWLLRNSWGTSWGESGYFKMLRDGSNNCSTACYAMYLKA